MKSLAYHALFPNDFADNIIHLSTCVYRALPARKRHSPACFAGLSLQTCVSPSSSLSLSSIVSSPRPRQSGHSTHQSVLLVAAAASIPRADTGSEFVTDAVETNAGSLVARHGSVPIGQSCSRDSQCASGCCGFNTARCAGHVVAQLHDGGCGHGSTSRKHKHRGAAN